MIFLHKVEVHEICLKVFTKDKRKYNDAMNHNSLGNDIDNISKESALTSKF